MNKKIQPQQSIFIGVSWPYANGNIHVGHLAGQYVVCDIFARYHRLRGNSVLMVSGSDSHGAPVIFAAEEQGIEPAELAKKSHELIEKIYDTLGLLYENYTTTGTENHKVVSQNIFLVLNELGFLTIKKTRQYYDPKMERFLPDRYIRGTCPHCGATNARGDECPECGTMLDPEELIDPYSTLSDAKPEIRETEHFYLDLSKVQGELSEWLQDKTHWRKWVREFTLGWLKGGLKPRAVTRDFSYGVPVPVKGWEHKVLYVWVEAVVGYLSAAIEWAHNQNDPAKWEEFWKNPDCRHYYFIAGGNVPFHTIIWPAEIIGYNKKFSDDHLWETCKLPGETKRAPLNLPYDVPANNILTYRGKKMSKGDKVGITLETLLDRYHPDVIRYFFARYAPESQDREFIWKDFIDANNNELVANIGNFINRVLTFINRRFEGIVPEGSLDPDVRDQIIQAFHDVQTHLEKTEFVKATEAVLALGHFANKHFDSEKPWETVKTDQARAGHSLYNSVQLVETLRTLLKPFLPFTADTLTHLLNLSEKPDQNHELATAGHVSDTTDRWMYNEIPSGHRLRKPAVLFEKLEYTEDLEREDNPGPQTIAAAFDNQLQRLSGHTSSNDLIQATERSSQKAPHGNLSFNHLHENISIGKIIKISPHPSKPSLNVAEVDAGGTQRLTIVCGAPNIKTGDIVPVALPGAKVKTPEGTSKIKETDIHGVKSQGMLCSQYELGIGEDHSGIFILPDSLGFHTGRPLKTVRPVHFSKDASLADIPTAWAVFSGISVRRARSRALEKWLKDQMERIKESPDASSWKGFRGLHEKFTGSPLPGSAEAIVTFIKETGTVPNINTFVDLYNVFSALTGISMGAHDIDKLDGQPRLTILTNDTPFRHATTNDQDLAKKGEYAYVDDRGILCRLDIKQSNRTAVTKDTRNILLLLQGNDQLTQQDLEKGLSEFQKLVDTLIEK